MYVLRYEDLLEKPEASLRDLIGFIYVRTQSVDTDSVSSYVLFGFQVMYLEYCSFEASR